MSGLPSVGPCGPHHPRSADSGFGAGRAYVNALYGAQWRDEHRVILADLIGQTGAFVREVSVYARMLAANEQQIVVSVENLRQSVTRLTTQLESGTDLMPPPSDGLRRAGRRYRVLD